MTPVLICERVNGRGTGSSMTPVLICECVNGRGAGVL